jgi:tetratricopeptide (TPR) repeat protein
MLTQRFRAETLLALNREADAAKALDEYLRETPEAPADVYQARGLLFADAGDTPAAVEMYTLALRLNPADNATRAYRGWTYLVTDAVRLALEDFERCLRNDPTNAEALAGRANARIRLKQLDGAVKDARAAEEAADKDGPIKDRVLYNLARVYAQAVGQLNLEARTAADSDQRTALHRASMYREKALALLGRALDALPKERRAAFWKNRAAVDPAFAAVRDGDPYTRLAGLYAGANP